MKRLVAVAVAAFLAGTLAGVSLAGTALAPITLQPGQSITIIAAAPTPSPAPTATPTLAPTASPTPSPVPSPTSSAPAACPGSLATAVSAAPAGATLNVTGCGPYAEIVTVKRTLTLIGASIRGANAAAQTGDLEISGASGVVIRDATVANSGGACISVDHATNVTVSGSTFAGCAQEGFHVTYSSGVTFRGNRVTGNNPAYAYSPGHEAGGGKVWKSSGVTFDANEVDHNGGPGIWFDTGNTAATITANRVHDNGNEGVFYEVSSGGLIADNAVWENGWHAGKSWCWHSGVLLSTSRTTEVRDNVLGWNVAGVTVVSQNRSDSPGPTTGISVHGNTVASGNANEMGAWCQDWSGVLFSDPSNHGGPDAFWTSVAEPSSCRFQTSGCFSRLSDYVATRFEQGGTYLTTSAMQAALTAAGIPLNSPHAP